VVLHFRREEELVGMGCWDFAWMEWRMRDLVGREGKGREITVGVETGLFTT
jgi:hypothetical protein